jgi:hypothetical protein
VAFQSTLPLFAISLGGVGLFGWRRKRKVVALSIQFNLSRRAARDAINLAADLLSPIGGANHRPATGSITPSTRSVIACSLLVELVGAQAGGATI